MPHKVMAALLGDSSLYKDCLLSVALPGSKRVTTKPLSRSDSQTCAQDCQLTYLYKLHVHFADIVA